MSYSFLFLEKAATELLDAFEWYEDRQQGLGDRFQQKVFAKISSIKNDPERYPVKFKEYREVKVTTFPFLIIYKIDHLRESVLIVSVFHTSRDVSKRY